MKVQCIRLINAFGEDVVNSPWLNIGEIYHVVSIFIDENGQKSYGVISSKKNIDSSRFSSHSSKCFSIISTKIFSGWVPWIINNSSIGISPRGWQQDGFMEKIFEGDELTSNIFRSECENIISEDP